ncbi:MAG: DinB family protein [Bryobacterales bacterium]|nr:DinB family protein [Bryobacterales bacterium]
MWVMNYYSAKDLAAAFRTVRNNTIKIAEEIPEDKYSFQAASDSRTVAQTLVHIALGTRFATVIHGEQKLNTLVGFNFYSFMHPMLAEEQKSRSKAEIVQLLRTSGDQFAKWLEGLSDAFLGEQVSFPEGAQPPAKSRFEMLLGVKEHEMHHRAQLMVLERMLGIVPHLTREQQARIAAMRASQS